MRVRTVVGLGLGGKHALSKSAMQKRRADYIHDLQCAGSEWVEFPATVGGCYERCLAAGELGS